MTREFLTSVNGSAIGQASAGALPTPGVRVRLVKRGAEKIRARVRRFWRTCAEDIVCESCCAHGAKRRNRRACCKDGAPRVRNRRRGCAVTRADFVIPVKH